MQQVLVATDSDAVFDEVDAALGNDEVKLGRISAGDQVRTAVMSEDPDLVILDLQIGSMGGVAACLDLRLEESGERIPPQRILLLLDREADVFLARHSGADGWVLKPLDSRRLRRAAAALLDGGTWMEMVDSVAR